MTRFLHTLNPDTRRGGDCHILLILNSAACFTEVEIRLNSRNLRHKIVNRSVEADSCQSVNGNTGPKRAQCMRGWLVWNCAKICSPMPTPSLTCMLADFLSHSTQLGRCSQRNENTGPKTDTVCGFELVSTEAASPAEASQSVRIMFGSSLHCKNSYLCLSSKLHCFII